MKNSYYSKFIYCLLSTLLIALSSYAQHNKNWSIYQMENLPFNTSKVYLDSPTISGVLYNISSTSVLKASKYDRMLFVVDGQSLATLSSIAMDLKTGDVVFLKANESIEFSSSIKIMLWASKSSKTDHKNQTEKFTKEQIEIERKSSKNVWNSFIETSTMVAGLYMLPKVLDGDDTLTHGFDEINYVINGTAKFKMDQTVIDVKPGSIMYVKKGVGHYFYELSEDFDVFILFETINMDHDH